MAPSQYLSPTTCVLQRKCACGSTAGPTGECEAYRKKRFERKSNELSSFDPNRSEVPSIVHEVLRSPGHPLDRETRAFMEPRFGHDFSHVRLHTDGRATHSARSVNALAYTVGNHIAVRSDQYAPNIAAGRGLLAHELAHVMQQSASGSGSSDAELRAGVASQEVMSGKQVDLNMIGASPVGLLRQRADSDPEWFLKLIPLRSELREISLQTALKLSREKRGVSPSIPADSPLLGEPRRSLALRPPGGKNESEPNLTTVPRGEKSDRELALKVGDWKISAGRSESDVPASEEMHFISGSPEWLRFLLDKLDGAEVEITKIIHGGMDKKKKGERKKLEEWRSNNR